MRLSITTSIAVAVAFVALSVATMFFMVGRMRSLSKDDRLYRLFQVLLWAAPVTAGLEMLLVGVQPQVVALASMCLAGAVLGFVYTKATAPRAPGFSFSA